MYFSIGCLIFHFHFMLCDIFRFCPDDTLCAFRLFLSIRKCSIIIFCPLHFQFNSTVKWILWFNSLFNFAEIYKFLLLPRKMFGKFFVFLFSIASREYVALYFTTTFLSVCAFSDEQKKYTKNRLSIIFKKLAAQETVKLTTLTVISWKFIFK